MTSRNKGLPALTVLNGPARSGLNPKMQARTRPEPENNLKLLTGPKNLRNLFDTITKLRSIFLHKPYFPVYSSAKLKSFYTE